MENDMGVLLLSHVGFSFMEDLVGTVAARGVKTYVLSSLPERQQESRPAALAELADDVRVTADHVLTARDVESYLDHLAAEGATVLCCLTVWEGYRHLMALANARLGVPDLDEKQVLGLRDKLTLRNRLADAGLTKARACGLTPETLDERRDDGGRYFVKPVSGIASFGTFPLTTDTTWTDVERIAAEARADTVYASAFAVEVGDEVEFLVEDYVPGREFSFEVIVVDGEPHVVAVHEKCEVTETVGTVLENACVSPPTSLRREETAAGIRWVAELLDVLGLSWGCFHVEARHSAHGWDLIEINPRVGGSMISPSVAALTGGPGLLDFWLDSMLTAGRPDGFLKALKGFSFTADGVTPSPRATFFRVFFADPGTIRAVSVADDLPVEPIHSKVLLKPGDIVEASSREVFLGEVLWCIDRAELDTLLPRLWHASKKAIRTEYGARGR
jgi:hypothetical protein